MKDISTILLDICGTLFPFQTPDKFIDFVITKKGLTLRKCKMYAIKFIFNIPLFSFGLKKLNFSRKFALLKLLKNLSLTELRLLGKEFFEELLKPNFCLKTLNFLQNCPNSTIIIVSGGYDIYLKYVADFLGASYCICSELEFVNGKFTGKIKGLDCMGINKVIKLAEAGLLEKISFETTAVLSDSISDLPLFSLGKYKIAVNPDNELKKLVGKGWYLLEEVV
jgi:HAD superfamily hydrolase (TIGR01490 family)